METAPAITTQPDPGLAALLSPRSLAVIGATDREGSVGRALLENIRRGGYRGRLYPVNPGRGSVLGLRAYPSVLAIPDEVDAAAVAVPAERVEGVVGECARKGVRGVVVLSSGFRECGGAGRALEASLEKTARSLGIALMGPNCLGLINTDPQVALNATFANRLPRPGGLSFLSQSGALGVYALEFAAAHSIGIRWFASIGNKAVLNENHLLRAFGTDGRTRVILAYLEDFHSPETFFELAADIASGPDPKPVVLLKAGTGTVARRAVASHTGALAEKTDFLDDLCRQYGIIRAANLEDLFNHALCLSRQPLPKGPRVAVVTNAGGPAILASEEAERDGLELPEPGPALRDALAGIRDSATATRNPIDLLGDADAGAFGRAISILLASGEFDSILAVSTPQRMTDMASVARAIAGQSRPACTAGVALLSSLAEFEVPSGGGRILDEAGIPNYPFAENAVRALAAACRFQAWRNLPRTWPESAGRADGGDARADTVRTVLEGARRAGRRFLPESDCAAVLQAYGIGRPRSLLATSRAGLFAASRELGFPLVAKLESPDVLHKADVGGVIAGIGDFAALEHAYDTLLRRAAAAKPGGARVQGVLLQEMVREGVECMVGAHRNPRFGVLVAFGLGGTLVEAIGDVVFRRAPLSLEDAEGMIRQIRARAVLGPFRGRPPRDVQALRDCLLRLSWLMADFPILSEVDFNPVFSLESGAVVADARMVLRTDEGSREPGNRDPAD